jgi:nucleotide-binding universal stress UspA family protein
MTSTSSGDSAQRPAHRTGRPILVGYDGSDGARTAVRWALDEGARSGEAVELAYAFEPTTVGSWIGPGIGPGVWPDEVARREVEAVVQQAAAEAAGTHPGVRVHGEVLDGPAALLLQERSARASLVVLGSRGHGGFTGLLTGSTAVTVCAHAHCPVVVVRGEEPQRTGPGPVVVGVDGSEHSRLALGFALDRAANREAPLHVIRAWAPPGPRSRPAEAKLAEITDTERAAVQEMVAGWRGTYPGVEVSVAVVTGNPSGALVEATREARLAVVGSRGLGGFRGLLLGSVSQQLIQHGHCPVAVVRELPPDQLPGEPAGAGEPAGR